MILGVSIFNCVLYKSWNYLQITFRMFSLNCICIWMCNWLPVKHCKCWISNQGIIFIYKIMTCIVLKQRLKCVPLNRKVAILRLLECNGFTYLKPSRGFKNLLIFKYMPFENYPPHRFSQFLLLCFYKQDWKFALYSYLGEVIRCNITSL